jgi:hypothetical protein
MSGRGWRAFALRRDFAALDLADPTRADDP